MRRASGFPCPAIGLQQMGRWLSARRYPGHRAPWRENCLDDVSRRLDGEPRRDVLLEARNVVEKVTLEIALRYCSISIWISSADSVGLEPFCMLSASDMLKWLPIAPGLTISP